MKRKLLAVIVSVVCVSVLISGCDKDENGNEAAGILVEDINGNSIVVANGTDANEVEEEWTDDEEEFDEEAADDDIEDEYIEDEELGDDEDIDEDSDGPGDEEMDLEEDILDEPSDGDMADDEDEEDDFDLADAPAPDLEDEDGDMEDDYPDYMDVPELDEDEPDVDPDGAVADETLNFTASSVAGSSVVASIGGYISAGAPEEAPDGSKVWSADNGTYSVDIEADESGNVYSAFFTSSGDKAYLASCASAFDGGAGAFVNSNDEGVYESGGLIFELEADDGEMASLRVTSSSYQNVLGSPI